MVLSDKQIMEAIEEGEIVITPFESRFLGSNSYDLHLAPTLMLSKNALLDCAKENEFMKIDIPEAGYVLRPNTLYLAATVEYTESHKHLPVLHGKSSLGRLGLQPHICAGFGDVGFCGFWTLELAVTQPLVIYPRMPIAQIVWHTTGECETPYNKKPSANYAGQMGTPAPSKLHKDFEGKKIRL